MNFSFGSAAIEPANVDASKVHLVVVDDRQHVALSAEHFHAELPGIVVTKRWGSRLELDFSADAAPPAPGMYRLEARFAPGAIVRDGVPAAPTVSGTANFYISRLPEREPALAVGQQFLDAAVESIVVPYPAEAAPDPQLLDALGRVVPRERIGLHALTLTHLDTSRSPHALTFTIDGIGTAELRTDADATHIAGLVPVVNDRDVMSLQHDYVGRTVWTIGTRTFGCIQAGSAGSTDNFDGGSEFTIEGIERADWPTDFAAIGEFSYRFDSDTAFSDARPIVVALARAPQTFADGGSGETMGAGGLGAACAGFSTRFADRWDFERALSRLPMRAAHPEWGRGRPRSHAKGRGSHRHDA